MATIQSKTCIKFVERNYEKDYITITGKDKGCFSSIGRLGGEQFVNYEPSSTGTGCFVKGTLLHELTHTMGFLHMHSSPERDDWVTIMFENIIDDKKDNFRKYSSTEVTNFAVQYDYGSVMHYPANAFSKNGDKTIFTKNPPNAPIGQRVAYSVKDIVRIRAMYMC